MRATIQRLLRTERTRLILVSGCMVAWFLLIMLVTRSAAGTITAKTDMLGGALTKGFGLGSLASPDALVAQMVAVSFNHPLVLAIVGSVTVTYGARACQGELLAGTLDVTLARAVSRTRYLLGYVVIMVLAVITLMTIAGISIVAFHRLFDVPGSLQGSRVALMCVNGTVVFVGFGAISLLVSVLLGRRGSALFASVAILVAMFADTFVERIWTNAVMDVVGPISLFHWFDPATILLGSAIPASHLLVPTLSSVACVGIALVTFERRDL